MLYLFYFILLVVKKYVIKAIIYYISEVGLYYVRFQITIVLSQTLRYLFWSLAFPVNKIKFKGDSDIFEGYIIPLSILQEH